MTDHHVYITSVNNKQEERKLKLYVDNLDKKIENAKWKHNLILTYNYTPLETMKQKLQAQRQLYIKRLQSGEARLSKQTQNDRVMKEVQHFKNFGVKLYNQMTQIQQRIQQIRMNMKIRLSEIEAKKIILKGILKQNAELNKQFIDKINQIQYEELRVKTANKQNPKLQGSVRKDSGRSKTTSKSSKYTIPLSSQINMTKQTYSQCVNALVKSLKSMNASEDIQAGIYLQIMNKKTQQKSATYSLKSKICDIIMDRYKDLRLNKTKQNENFSMSLQTFMGLNWKQIMGILLIKDRDASQLRRLLNTI